MIRSFLLLMTLLLGWQLVQASSIVAELQYRTAPSPPPAAAPAPPAPPVWYPPADYQGYPPYCLPAYPGQIVPAPQLAIPPAYVPSLIIPQGPPSTIIRRTPDGWVRELDPNIVNIWRPQMPRFLTNGTAIYQSPFDNPYPSYYYYPPYPW